MKIMDQL